MTVRSSCRPWVLSGVGLCWLAVGGWVLATRFDTLVAGHPLYPVLLVLTLGVGAALLVLARSGRLRRPAVLVAWTLVSALVLGTLGWLRPSSATSQQAADGVLVTQDARTITLTPAKPSSGVGLVFQPEREWTPAPTFRC